MKIIINPHVRLISGSVTGASNIGIGTEIYKQNIGGELQFKSLLPGSGIDLIEGVNEITILNNQSGSVPETRTINGYSLDEDIVLNKTDIELGDVDNTSDMDKPLSSASLQALEFKLDKNELITPGTFTKLHVDEYGLVTSGSVATTEDIEEVENKRYVNDSHLIVLNNTSGINTGDSSFENIGTGEGLVFKELSGSVVQLKTLKAGTNIILENNENDITINSSGSSVGSFLDLSDTPSSYIANYDLKVNSSGSMIELVEGKLYTNRTINLNSSMSALDIQNLINVQPKNLNNYNLTFQFADGTYNLNSSLSLLNFNYGIVLFNGNLSNNTLSKTKLVHLNFSTDVTSGLYLLNNIAHLYIRYFKITMNKTTSDRNGLYIDGCIKAWIQFNYVLGVSSSDNMIGLNVYESRIRTFSNYIGLSTVGISSFNSHVLSQTNDDGGAGDQPVTGLGAHYNGVIGKADGDSVNGSTANESTSNGGVIR